MKCFIDSKALSNVTATPISVFGFRLYLKLYQMRSLDHDCTRWRCHFARLAVQLVQGFSLHLEFHLGILFKDLSIPSTEHLGYALIRDTASA
jgi:hypothetical protein